MNMPARVLIFFLLLIQAYMPAIGQEIMPETTETVISMKMLGRLNQKASSVNENVDKQTSRYLQRLAKREQKLRKELFKVDSSAAKALFDNAAQQYNTLNENMRNASKGKVARLTGKYVPGLDSLQGSLNFVDNNKRLLGLSKDASEKLQSSLDDVNQLQSRLGQADEVSLFLKERQAQIKEVLGKYTNLPNSLGNNFKSYSKEACYYSEQIKEYREILNKPDKLQQKSLELLNKLPAFREFMQKNSILAGLFSVPENYGTPEALNGLQTRAQVQQSIGRRIGTGGVSSVNPVQQQIEGAQAQLSQLRNKINQLGGNNGELVIPDFKPNTQRTKSFLQRLEYGSSIQTVKSNSYFPTTSDIALSLGYKINDKSVVGIGTAYKLGLGKDIRHISFTHQGIGLRSYLDYKIKGNFWISGGGEMNYRTPIKNFSMLKNATSWQYSALIGLSKRYQVSKKLRGNAQLLYDALWNKQVPRAQPVVFRVGYCL